MTLGIGMPLDSWLGVRGLAIAMLACLLLVVGCQSRESRIESHLERAEAYLAEGRGNEAILELRSAAQLAPDDVQIALRVADASAAQGYLGDAIDFYREANALAPDDSAIAIKLARLLVIEKTERADELVDSVLEREPNHVEALVVKAHVAIARDDAKAALGLIERARRHDPDDPEVSWGQAKVYEARIQDAKMLSRRRLAPDRDYELAVRAYDAYLAADGKNPMSALLARAQLLASWPGHLKQASEAYLDAIKQVREIGTPYERIQLLKAARLFGKANKKTALERRALRAWTAIEPYNLKLYEQWAEVERPEDGTETDARTARYQAVYERMLHRQPDNPAAHVIYGHHLARDRDFNAGILHLRGQLDSGMDDSVLLAGISDIQLTHGRHADAKATINELQRRFPEHLNTTLLLSRQLVVDSDLDAAARLLEELLEREASTEASILLTQIEMRRGRYGAALAAVDAALAQSRGRSPESHRLRAAIQLAMGDAVGAIVTLKRIQLNDGLTSGDMLLLVRAYYDNQQGAFGRKLLIDLLQGGEVPVEASLELYRREKENAYRRFEIQQHLQDAYARYPRNIDLLAALTDLDLQAKEAGRAIARLESARYRMPRSPRLLLLRAHTAVEIGRYQSAIDDAEQAMQLSPEAADEAITLLVDLYSRSAQLAAVIARLEASDKDGRLPANRIALLGRLQVQTGRHDAAIATYERALAEGSQLTLIKNDLAFLLAKSGRDLDRALRLAREAADADGEKLTIADTLGFVYLQSGEYEAALWQFQYAIANMDPPVAEYYYHLALALVKLERTDEARYALAQALAIDPNLRGAAEAQGELRHLAPEDGGASGAS